MGTNQNYGNTTKETTLKIHRQYMEVLVGGGYEDSKGDINTYGHVALRLSYKEFSGRIRDEVYDFGRYGESLGYRSAKGEGVLKVWKRFDDYIQGEQNTGRLTKGYFHYIDDDICDNVIGYYGMLMNTSTRTEELGAYTKYFLKFDYHAINFNCAVIVMNALSQRGISRKMIKNTRTYRKDRGLEGYVQDISNYTGGNSLYGIFMPLDFAIMFYCENEPDSVNYYRDDSHENKNPRTTYYTEWW